MSTHLTNAAGIHGHWDLNRSDDSARWHAPSLQFTTALRTTSDDWRRVEGFGQLHCGGPLARVDDVSFCPPE